MQCSNATGDSAAADVTCLTVKNLSRLVLASKILEVTTPLPNFISLDQITPTPPPFLMTLVKGQRLTYQNDKRWIISLWYFK